MSISAQMVKELREKTGAGMMDCKKALVANDGDMEKAIDWLREKGLSKAAKKAGRATTEGLLGVHIAEDGKSAVAVEVKCETDFVARGDKFQDFVKQVLGLVVSDFPADTASLLARPAEGGTVQDMLNSAIATIGENMQIGRAVKMELSNPGVVGSYLHSNGKLVALVEVNAATVNDAVLAAAKNVAMQVAAANPLAVDAKSLDPAAEEREREVYRQKARAEGKPEQIVERIAEGAVKKFHKEVCLLDQPYIRDDKKSVADMLKEASKEAGTPITVARFVRLQLGVE
ncbi:MAG: elongation factor Ts [Desulfovibrionaceae bacterium]|nr:elongation factor Ts [Desulfovibrionaceae bacterium]